MHRAKFLYRICKYFNVQHALELGTSVGIASAAMASHKNLQLTTVEGCSNTARIAEGMFKRFQFQNINVKMGQFQKELDPILQNKPVFDLVYFDGAHTYEDTIHFFQILKSHARNQSVFVFDDIYWSPEMLKAWREIIADPVITVSIDTYKQGLVFFRKEQVKQDFKIRL